MRQLAADHSNLIGLECCLTPWDSHGLDQAVASLVEKHADLKKVKIAAIYRDVEDDEDEYAIYEEEDVEQRIYLRDQGLSALLRLRNLTVLHLENTLITGNKLTVPKGGDSAKCLNQLRVLNLSGCWWITDKGLGKLLQLCGNKLQGWKFMSCSHCQE